MGELKPYLAMFVTQLIYSGLTLLSKAVFNGGMNTCVFTFYRQLTGAVILVPLALILERKRAVPVSLSFLTFCKIFVFSFFGLTLTLNMQAIALVYTSATLVAAIVNSLPASTLFFAVLLRMEKVNIRTKSGITKIGSVLLCLVGVATLAFYKGPQLRTAHHILSRYHNHGTPHHEDHFSSGKRWILGSLLLFLSVTIWSFWLIIQAQILKSYPAKLKFTSLQCLSSSIQSFGIAIAFERDIQQWKLGWNMRLLAVVYCGALVTGVVYYLQAWVIEKRGPVFPAMWNPLSFIIATTGSILLLGEPLRLGSVLGGIMLVLSLYSVLWAKNKEGMTHQNSLPVQECEEGALVTGVVYYLQAWVIEKRGPVFPAMWNPLSFIIATTGSILLLGEPLRLGCVLGGIMLVLSLYSVLWAKSKEGMTHQNSLPVQECEEASSTEPPRPA